MARLRFGLAALAAAVSLGTAISAFATDTSVCTGGEKVIRFSHVTAEVGHPKGRTARALADRVNSELNGKLCMVIYPNAELYSDDDELWQAMRDGKIEMAAPSLAKMSGFSKSFQVFDLPFMFADMGKAIDFTYTPEAIAVLDSLGESGFKGLAYWMNGMRQITANRAVSGPEDLEGLTFRISGSPVGKAYYGLLGVDTVKMSFSKVFAALEAGEIDGQENSWSNIYTKKFHTVQHSVNETNHSLIAYSLITTEAFWDSLDPQVREQLEWIILETTHEYNGFAYQIDEVNRQRVIESGASVKVLSEGQRLDWINALSPVWSQFEGEIGPGIVSSAAGS